MADANWTQTRAALASLSPFSTAKLLPKVLVKAPKLISKAQELMVQYSFSDDKFKIYMIHNLERELPELKDVYQALLADLMSDKARLEA